jgi:hypothetical protein
MANRPTLWIMDILLFIGAFLPKRAIFFSDKAIDFLELGRWMRAKGYNISRRFKRREDLFDFVASQLNDREVLYLEFGVAEGDVTRQWSKLLLNPNSKLHGFDSFEGLPEDYVPGNLKGHFSTGGVAPQIEDSRVKFFKGWFEDTLPQYECPSHEVLVVHLDADLYSSTIFVLRTLREQIVPGTYIYFDEFCVRRHELRAFDEFINETGMKFSLVGGNCSLSHVVFKRES